MPKITDQDYLKNQQYKTADNLNTRIKLHSMYGTNPYGWHKWVFDQVRPESGMRFLEVGCGPGDLWCENIMGVPGDLVMYLSDYSYGMVQDTKCRVRGNDNFRFLNLDAQSIPLQDRYFDAVIANHMLYHVPDISHGIREISRVLKKSGILYAATNGRDHMIELRELINKYKPEYHECVQFNLEFNLENAKEILSPYFSRIDIRMYDENLKVIDPQPLIDYILSMWNTFNAYDDSEIQAIRSDVNKVVKRNGYYWITKSQGLVIARN